MTNGAGCGAASAIVRRPTDTSYAVLPMTVPSGSCFWYARDWKRPSSVTLSPTGELPLIQDGNDYSQIGLDVEILKPDNGEAVYVDGRAALIP